MGNCQDKDSLDHSELNIGRRKTNLQVNGMKPLNISIIGDSDRLDEFLQGDETSIKEIQSPMLGLPSETIIIDMRSGSSLPSPIKQKSSKNLNQKFLEML